MAEGERIDLLQALVAVVLVNRLGAGRRNVRLKDFAVIPTTWSACCIGLGTREGRPTIIVLVDLRLIDPRWSRRNIAAGMVSQLWSVLVRVVPLAP